MYSTGPATDTLDAAVVMPAPVVLVTAVAAVSVDVVMVATGIVVATMPLKTSGSVTAYPVPPEEATLSTLYFRLKVAELALPAIAEAGTVIPAPAVLVTVVAACAVATEICAVGIVVAVIPVNTNCSPTL